MSAKDVVAMQTTNAPVKSAFAVRENRGRFIFSSIAGVMVFGTSVTNKHSLNGECCQQAFAALQLYSKYR